MTRMLFVFGLVFNLIGCSSESSHPTFNPGLDLAGSWHGRINFNGEPAAAFGMHIRHNRQNARIDGIYRFKESADGCFSSGTLEGDVVGSRIGFSMQDTRVTESGPDGTDSQAQIASSTATLILAGNTTNRNMQGIFNVNGGPCHGRGGHWSAGRRR